MTENFRVVFMKNPGLPYEIAQMLEQEYQEGWRLIAMSVEVYVFQKRKGEMPLNEWVGVFVDTERGKWNDNWRPGEID